MNSENNFYDLDDPFICDDEVLVYLFYKQSDESMGNKTNFNLPKGNFSQEEILKFLSKKKSNNFNKGEKKENKNNQVINILDDDDNEKGKINNQKALNVVMRDFDEFEEKENSKRI